MTSPNHVTVLFSAVNLSRVSQFEIWKAGISKGLWLSVASGRMRTHLSYTKEFGTNSLGLIWTCLCFLGAENK